MEFLHRGKPGEMLLAFSQFLCREMGEAGDNFDFLDHIFSACSLLKSAKNSSKTRTPYIFAR